nr:hypothetical protein CFP56_72137 [Quercus suber]
MANAPLETPKDNMSATMAINDTPIRRCLTKLALKTTARLYRRYDLCHRISPNKIVKTGPFVDLTEAATMQFVAARTSIPVPQIHCAFVSRGRVYIVMERLQGKPIAQVVHEANDSERETLLLQLKGHLDSLRALPPPAGTGIESCVSGDLYDSRMPRPTRRFGPFRTIQEFHVWLRDGFEIAKFEDEEHRAELEKMALKQDGTWPAPVFTHGDLNPYNILVHKGRISGFVDWEFAGWYPHYWEYTSAWYGNRLRTTWPTWLERFLTPYPEELEMEITRQRWWGEF